MWFYETKIGIFTIRERSGKYHVYFDGEDLGSYDTPWQASEDLAGGRMPTLSCGVDTATANLIAGLPELGQLNRQQIAKLVGLAPLVRDSGKFKGQRRTCAGRGHIRRVLYMAALVATRWNSRIRAFYLSLLERGKPKKLALTACMRKLLTILNSMVKNNQTWEQNLYSA